ncbi:radical SAM protein [Halobacteriovorax sp. GB3]|uniref:SPL family radical SAM protein n=1 Tax=Halobacteriovorax sp. GB3 TaxID=2719615 RepID=UPI002361F1E2|nr:radical SAM protein [Halobacteriovorax sp. GB3]MDD0852003.1 radical SAM protein [Halobacteriovorax sp. GB3]
MFNRIFIEKDLRDNPRAKAILNRFSSLPVKEIDAIDDVFQKVKKPYLQKRDNLNLFLGTKKGKLVKEAPDAYGLSGDPHYYFIHAYNCIYECNYCYLQGYFHSPDIVLFLNHEEIANEIEAIAKEQIEKNPTTTPWFHAGEFSDSLALSHITGELPFYFEVFKNLPQGKLEFRTKSANVKNLLELSPLPNVITSFSLSPADKIKKNDLKTPSLKARLSAISKLAKHGHPIGIHFDPVIYDHDFKEKYTNLLKDLTQAISANEIEYISIGVVRFTKDVYQQVKMNYPESELLAEELIKAEDGKVRYARAMRMWILQTIKELCLEAGIDSEKIYLCMED